MKFTPNTLEILKNFSNINPSILFKDGDVLMTRSTSNTIIAIGHLDQHIEKTFAILDLSQFISVLSLYKEPNLVFDDDKVIIGEDNRNVKYKYTEPSLITCVDYEKIKNTKLPFKEIANFTLTTDQIQKMLKSAAVLSLPNITFECNKGKLSITSCDIQNPASNKVEFLITELENKINFTVNYNVDVLKMLPDDYAVTVYESQITKLESNRMTYYIVAEIIT